MLRCAQMLLGHTLSRLVMGRDWRLPLSPVHHPECLQAHPAYQQMLRLFCDEPGSPHIFSIHHIVQAGMRYDKLPGEWFEPSTSALVLRDLVQVYQKKLGGHLAVYVTRGDVVYQSEAEAMCRDTSLDDSLLSITLSAQETPDHLTGHHRHSHRQDTNHSKNNTSSNSCDNETVSEVNLKRLSVRSQTRLQLQQHQVKSTVFTGPGPTSPTPDPLSSHSHEETSDAFFDPLFRPPPSYVLPWTQSLLLLIPLRLGVSSISAEHLSELTFFLRQEACVGILGGRPNHAIYFTGYFNPQYTSSHVTHLSQKDFVGGGADEAVAEHTVLLGLDPHTTYSAAVTRDPFPATTESATHHDTFTHDTNSATQQQIVKFPSDALVEQLHVSRFVTLPVSQLDPSLAIGFLFATREEFDKFVSQVRHRVTERLQRGLSVLFQIEYKPPDYYYDDEDDNNNEFFNSSSYSGGKEEDEGVPKVEPSEGEATAAPPKTSKVDKNVLRMMLGDSDEEEDTPETRTNMKQTKKKSAAEEDDFVFV